METLIIYTSLRGDTQFIYGGALDEHNALSVDLFMKCADACADADFKGFSLGDAPRHSKFTLRAWVVDGREPAGDILLKLYVAAMDGVMPPTPDEVVAQVRKHHAR